MSTLHCYHCREITPSNINISGLVAGQAQSFCCYGCLGVAQWIDQEGLNQYYDVRTSAPKADNIQFEQYLHFDLPEIYQKHTYQEGELTCIDISINGIHCAACVWLIEKALLKIAGVQRVQGNASTFALHISWDNQQVTLSSLLVAIAKLGYVPILSHGHTEQETVNQIRRTSMKKLIVSGLGMMQVMMFSAALYAGAWQGIDAASKALLQWVSFFVTSPVYLYSGSVFIGSAFRALKNRSVNMDVPVALAITLAYFFSVYHLLKGEGEIYFDTVVMFVFFLSASRHLEMMSRYKALLYSNQNTAILPEVVIKLKQENEQQIEIAVPLDAVKSNDQLLIRAGETIPVDGEIISGETTVNESLLTGEDRAIPKSMHDQVFAGSINQEQTITILVIATQQLTTLAQTQRLLRQAKQQKPKIAELTDKIASYIVVFILLSTTLSFIIWHFILQSEKAFEIALSVLVATCPCALSLAVPTAYAASSNMLAKYRLFIKNHLVLDKVKHLQHIIFDKTGTLTTDDVTLTETKVYGEQTVEEVLAIAAAMERYIHHPIAKAFSSFLQDSILLPKSYIKSGKGLQAEYQGYLYTLGNYEYVGELVNQLLSDDKLYLARKGSKDGSQLIADFTLSQQSSTYAPIAIKQLSLYQLHIASGDSQSRVQIIAQHLGISQYHANMSPADKLELLKQLQTNDKTVMMVGDGINDAPVLAGADISIAVGDASVLSKSQADVVLLNNDLRRISKFIFIANKTRRIILQNISWAICYNLLAIPTAIMGYLPPWVAALGMSLSSLIVLLNALRLYIGNSG